MSGTWLARLFWQEHFISRHVMDGELLLSCQVSFAGQVGKSVASWQRWNGSSRILSSFVPRDESQIGNVIK